MDLRIMIPLLYRLSYTANSDRQLRSPMQATEKMAGEGLEPPTFGL